jgi:hypothetical protein
MTRIDTRPQRPISVHEDGKPHLTQVGTNRFQGGPGPGGTYMQLDVGNFAKKKNFQGCSPELRVTQLKIKENLLNRLSHHKPDSLFGKMRIALKTEYEEMLAWHEEALAKPAQSRSPKRPYAFTQVGTNLYRRQGPNGTQQLMDVGNFARNKRERPDPKQL